MAGPDAVFLIIKSLSFEDLLHIIFNPDSRVLDCLAPEK
jgi:hypothetical protein